MRENPRHGPPTHLSLNVHETIPPLRRFFFPPVSVTGPFRSPMSTALSLLPLPNWYYRTLYSLKSTLGSRLVISVGPSNKRGASALDNFALTLQDHALT